MTRAMVIGLDCAPPSLVFERWAGSLPNLSALRARGRWGPMRSSRPPITVPAWAVMTSGRDPGELGLYGFRNKVAGSTDLRVATAKDVKVKRLWERLGERGKRVASLFVPLTSPPVPVRGHMVSGFLTPPGAPFAFPPRFGAELEARFGAYHADVRDFRSGELERVFEELDAMAEQHFAIARYVWTEKKPDFLMMVEMGPDRLHHACWHHLDPTHPRYVPGNPWEARARGYYARLDSEVGRLVELAGPDTHVFVVSDHGARAMRGGLCINELLRDAGWQRWHREPDGIEPLRDVIDWSGTRAWGEGGYYARIFLNVRGREPEGQLDPRAIGEAKRELRTLLSAAATGTEVDDPAEVYRDLRGHPPDLMAYFAGLDLRAIGTVGHGAVQVERDGEDGCNHDWNGVFVHAGPGIDGGPVELSIDAFHDVVCALFE